MTILASKVSFKTVKDCEASDCHRLFNGLCPVNNNICNNSYTLCFLKGLQDVFPDVDSCRTKGCLTLGLHCIELKTNYIMCLDPDYL